MVRKGGAFIGALAFCVCAVGTALAQEPQAPPPSPIPPAPAAPQPPAPPPAPPRAGHDQATGEEESDHDRFVHHIGVTYFDIANLPIAAAGGGAGTVSAPVGGVRYWLRRNLGLDLGIGIGWASASTTSVDAAGTSTSVDQPSPFGVAVHAGLPLAFAYGKHYSFLVVPETTLGLTSETVKNIGAPDTNLSGILYNVGARVGAEIHFGFIGIPQLALQGSLGLFLAYQQVKASQSGTSASTSNSIWSLSTTVGPNPWAIFTNNISATYYL